jgi:glycosyltransferase involved in cell wall biosynthesis
MKALFIGSDPTLVDAGSSSYQRQRSYAEAIGTLHILMRTSAGGGVRADGPLTLHMVAAGKLDAKKLVEYARALITTEAIEVVSAQDPFEHGWVAKEAVKGTNAKLHIQVHTDFLSPWFVRGGIARSPQVPMPVKNRLRRHLADLVLPKANGIRVVSERVRDSLRARYGARISDPVVLPIAVGTDIPPAAELPRHAFPFALMTTGRLEPEKRIEDIIEAIGSIKDRYPAVGLIVVGEGSERSRLMTLVVEKGLMGRVVFTGERADAWGLMRSAQGYIQASAYEGYGRTLVEAALARVPIITTDVGIVGEVFKGYEDVLAAPPGDPTQLALNIVALLEDVSARETMVRSAEFKAKAHLAHYAQLPQLITDDLARLLVPHAP